MSNSAFTKDTNIADISALTDGAATLPNAQDINTLPQDNTASLKDIVFINSITGFAKQTTGGAVLSYEFVADYNPSNVSDLIITGLNNDCAYEIYYDNIQLSTTATSFNLQLGDSSNIFNGASDYFWSSYYQELGPVSQGERWGNPSSDIQIGRQVRAVEQMQGFMRFVGLRSGQNAMCYVNTFYEESPGAELSSRCYGTCVNATTNTDRIRIFAVGATFSGNFSLYKIVGI